MVELLKGVDVETQNQIYEKMIAMGEKKQEAFADQLALTLAERSRRLNGSAQQRELREARAPKVGEPAPDFEISTLDSDTRVRLSSLRGHPVGLIFGSYT